MAKKDEDKTKSAPDENPEQTEPKKVKQVRVICDGYLGTKLLQKGDVTDDPQYVAILARKGQKLVEAVK